MLKLQQELERKYELLENEFALFFVVAKRQKATQIENWIKINNFFYFSCYSFDDEGRKEKISEEKFFMCN